MTLECLIGIKFQNYVLMASDMSRLQSIVLQKGDDDKMCPLSSHLMMAVSGEAGDTSQFSEYIAKNVQLYKMRNGYDMPPSAAAHFTRNTIATHLRSREPYMVNLLMGGYDVDQNTSELYYIDYLGASIPINFFAFGYGGKFTLSVLDKDYRPDMTQEEGIELLAKCINEIKRRFIINLPQFRVHSISKEGVKKLKNIVAEGSPA